MEKNPWQREQHAESHRGVSEGEAGVSGAGRVLTWLAFCFIKP